MAKVYSCDGCEVEQAITLVQNTDTGETLLFGPRCLLTWAEGMVAALRETLGENTPDGGDGAATGELSAGQDTPDSAVAGPEGVGPAALAATDIPNTEVTGGGGNDERVRTPDPGTTGVHPVGAGAPGPDDAGADRLGGRGGGQLAGDGAVGDGAAGGNDAGQLGSAGDGAAGGSDVGAVGDDGRGDGLAATGSAAGGVTTGP